MIGHVGPSAAARARPDVAGRPTRRQFLVAAGMLGVAAATGLGAAALTRASTVDFKPVPIGGGGYVTGLTIHPSGRLYIRTDVGGAYRREDDRWVQLITSAGVPEPHPSDYQAEALAVAATDPDVVYVAVGATADTGVPGRVLRSDDGGRTWRSSHRSWSISGNQPWRFGGSRLAVDPQNSDVVYLGTRSDGAHMSVDGGMSWIRIVALPGATDVTAWAAPVGINCLLIDESSPVVDGRHTALWAAVAGVGLCRSTDGGATWVTASRFAGGWVRDAVLTPGGGVMACFFDPTSDADCAVRRVTADGSSTEIAPQVDRGWSTVAVDPRNPASVVLAADAVNGQARLFRSLDATSARPTWSALGVSISNGASSKWPEASDVRDYLPTGQMRFDSRGVLWFAEGSGVWHADGFSRSAIDWVFDSMGIEELVANDLVKPPGAPLLTASWDRGVFRHPMTADPAVVETASAPYRREFGSAWALSECPTDPSFVVAVLDDSQDLSGRCNPERRASGFSVDSGATWTRFEALRTGVAPEDMLMGNIAVSAGDPSNIVWVPSLLSGRQSRIYVTSDRGRNWRAARTDGLADTDFFHPRHTLDRHVLAADPDHRGQFYLLGSDVDGRARFWRSNDGGYNWSTPLVSGLDTGEGEFSSNSRLVVLGGRRLFLAIGVRSMFRSQDGEHWEQMSDVDLPVGLGVGASRKSAGYRSLYVFATVAGTRGFHVSDDDGDSWEFLAADVGGLYQDIRGIVGDREIGGRFYVGTAGLGYMTGQVTA